MILALLAVSCLLSLGALLAGLAAVRAASRAPAASTPDFDLLGRLAAFERQLEAAPRDVRSDLGERMNELRQLLAIQFTQSEERFGRFAQEQGGHLTGLRAEAATGRKDAEEALGRHVTGFSDAQTRRLSETNAQMKDLQERTEAALKAMGERLQALTKEHGDRADALKLAVQGHLDTLREGNEKKLDEMRATVDEKLQSTLDQRLDASFKQVSDRLESVQKGLGEMQTLATGVGDLKRVLTNVKTRGAWGEVQLGALLEDTLNTDQYAAQVQVRPRSAERVDFAVRLPGHDDKGQVWLPIDCKFPHEDYARLLAAQDAADPVAVEVAGKGLEQAVARQAKTLADKYVCTPYTTDFAYLYVPTEGLFAEIVRREGFTAELRERHRVEIAGPSTLTALLNSLRVGFRSLQIQRKSSEVWTELGKVKTAFERYGDALEAVDKKLSEAKNKVSDVSQRHQAVLRSLRNVEGAEALEAPAASGLEAASLLALAGEAREVEDEAA